MSQVYIMSSLLRTRYGFAINMYKYNACYLLMWLKRQAWTKGTASRATEAMMTSKFLSHGATILTRVNSFCALWY